MQKLTRPLSNNLLFSFLGILFFLSSTKNLLAQCPTGSTEVTVTYTTGAFDNENSWVLWDATNNMSLACYEESQVGTNIQTACVPNGAQIELITYESFGDGWHESTISVEVSEDGTDGSSCSNIASTSIFSNLAPINGEGSPNNPGSIPQGEIDVCPPASVPTDIACQNTFSIDNTCAITGSSTTSIVGPTGPLCVEEQFTFTGGTTGSTWSGSFITDNRDGTATFTAFFPGTYTVLLTNGTGCSVASVVTVEGINPFTDGQSQLCPSSDAVLLGPANPNTSWSGTGVTNNGDGTATFDPSIAGLGLHTATFTYSNATTGCIYTREFDFSVNNSTPPDPGSYGPVCISGGPITLVGNPPDVNGFWFGPEVTDNQDGTATFDPSAFGGNTTVTINYGINGGCISETEIEIIGGDPFVPNYNPFCETDGDFTWYL